jgi:hypothetical protein
MGYFCFHKENGAPKRIRTSDLPLRRGPRYPAVPPGQCNLQAVGIVAIVWHLANNLRPFDSKSFIYDLLFLIHMLHLLVIVLVFCCHRFPRNIDVKCNKVIVQETNRVG